LAGREWHFGLQVRRNALREWLFGLQVCRNAWRLRIKGIRAQRKVDLDSLAAKQLRHFAEPFSAAGCEFCDKAKSK